MQVFGIILIVVLCLVLAIALFFEIKSLVKSIRQYKTRKSSKNQDEETNQDK